MNGNLDGEEPAGEIPSRRHAELRHVIEKDRASAWDVVAAQLSGRNGHEYRGVQKSVTCQFLGQSSTNISHLLFTYDNIAPLSESPI
jgi:hypothetical protein